MGRKDFNKGMEAGARPFEEKFRQMGQEFKDFSGKMEEDIDNIKRTNEAILDEMDSMQKKQFYRDNTAVDIAVLEKGDRETLLSILFTLAETEENVNKYQQLFIRSVRKYLENEEDGRKPKNWSVLKGGSWSIIETIIGIEETKAIAQAVMEFLFLGYGNHEAYFEEYEDLFDCFCLNRKGFGEIRAHIDNIYRATGLEGIAENYGYVPEESKEGEGKSSSIFPEKEYGSHGALEELKIVEEIKIADGGERVFKDKKIVIANKILAGNNVKLVFQNCEISVDGYMFGKNVEFNAAHQYSCIDTGRDCLVKFESCTIKKVIFNLSGTFQHLYDGEANTFVYSFPGTKMTVQNCLFDGSYYGFYHGGNGCLAEIRHSYIDWVTEGRSVSYSMKNWFFMCDNMEIVDTTVCEKAKNGDMGCAWLDIGTNLRVERCHFKDCSDLFFKVINTEIDHSDFDNCIIGLPSAFDESGKGEGKILFRDCILQNCNFKENSNMKYAMRFENSKLLLCIGELPTRYMKDVISDGGFLYLTTGNSAELIGCKFHNWSYKLCEDELKNRKAAIIIGSGSKITSCHFQNLDLGHLSFIGGDSHNRSISCQIVDCSFTDIKAGDEGILKKQYRYYEEGIFRTKWFTGHVELDVRNCTGL